MLLRFQPIYHQRPWGGSRFESLLQRHDLPKGPLGESWDIVDRPCNQSIVIGGKWNGYSLRELIAQHAAEIMGPKWPPNKSFPIIFKWLDCNKRLSLQVHPCERTAPLLQGEPKHEWWYVAECSPEAGIFLGLKRPVNKETFKLALENNSVEPLLKRVSIGKGDHFEVQGGCLHCLDKGSLILEIQQNSDTTYRVYDWGRLGLDGKPRTLHIEAALSCTKLEGEALPLREKSQVNLLHNPYFSIKRHYFEPGKQFDFEPTERVRVLSVVEGIVAPIKEALLRKGDHALLPYQSTSNLVALSKGIFLETTLASE